MGGSGKQTVQEAQGAQGAHAAQTAQAFPLHLSWNAKNNRLSFSYRGGGITVYLSRREQMLLDEQVDELMLSVHQNRYFGLLA